MHLTTTLHPLITDRTISLLKQFSVITVVQLLSMKPEKLCSILSLPFSTVTQLRMDIFRDHGTFPKIGLEVYQASLEEEVQVKTGSAVLDEMVGGLQGGMVYEVFGCPGSGKTELCMTAAAEAAGEGGRVMYLDSKDDFDPARLAQIVSRRGRDVEDMALVMVAKVHTYKELLHAVTKVVEEWQDIKLMVVDNITCLIMHLMEENKMVRTGFAIGCKVSHLLHKVASMLGAVVMVVSNMKGGEMSYLPALGGIWGGLADVRLFMDQVTEDKRVVRVVRGRGTGADCKVIINELGLQDCDLTN